MTTRPNVLLIVWHDLGDWLGCYGHAAIRSPRLDRLAAEGALFTRCYSTGAVCSPGRASLMTGLMPHSSGVNGLTNRGFDMRRDVRTLPQLLRDRGYETTLIGLQHECHDARWEGYDIVLGERTDAAGCAAAAVRFLEARALQRESGRPFFLSIGTQDVHRPYGDTYAPEVLERVRAEGLPGFVPNVESGMLDTAVFFSNIEQADREMGRIFDALDRSGLSEETIVLFTTDHGADFPRGKVTLYEPGTKIALLLRWPGRVAASTRVEELVSNVDVLPTLCDLVGMEPPGEQHGRSFAARVTGTPGFVPRTEVFAEFSWSTTYRPMRAIRTETHRLIVNYEPGLPPHIGGGAIKRYGPEVIEAFYARPLPPEELYHLPSDPNELRDLSGDPAHDTVRQELRGRLDDWLARTDDPILRGPIPNPDPTQTFPPLWEERDGRLRLRRLALWMNARP